MQAPVIIVIGKPQVGKTEARKMLCALTGLRGESCSTVIDHVLAQQMQISVEKLRQIPKEELRPKKVEVGDFLTGNIGKTELLAPDFASTFDYRMPSMLVRTLFLNGYNIIDGVRRPLELQHARHHIEWNGIRTLVLWIERPQAPAIQDNSSLAPEHADEVVMNDGTLEDLKAQLRGVLERNFPRPKDVPPPPVVENVQDLKRVVEQATGT